MSTHDRSTDAVIAAFDEHLRRARGVCPEVRRNYARVAHAFLQSVFDGGEVDLTRICVRDVVEFVSASTHRYQPATVQLMATSLRSFFRFARAAGLRADRLEDAVPAVPRRRNSLPRHLGTEQFTALLASLDVCSPRALRDRAIILCVARLGLRASEVARLRLEDVDWRNATVHVVTRKTGHGALLPLPDDLGRPAPARRPGCRGSRYGSPRPGLHVFQSGPVSPVQDFPELLLPPGPVIRRPLALGLPRPAGVFPDRGVQHRDRLGERDRHVGVGGGLASRPGRFALQLDQPLGGGVRLGGLQPGQVVRELDVTAAPPAQLVPGPRVALLVDGVVEGTLNELPGGQAQGLCARSPPMAGWFPCLGGVDVITAAASLGAGLALVLPDVAQVVALGNGNDDGQRLPPSRSRDRGVDHDHSDECNGLRGCGSW